MTIDDIDLDVLIDLGYEKAQIDARAAERPARQAGGREARVSASVRVDDLVLLFNHWREKQNEGALQGSAAARAFLAEEQYRDGSKHLDWEQSSESERTKMVKNLMQNVRRRRKTAPRR